jgi:hypothetical protein
MLPIRLDRNHRPIPSNIHNIAPIQHILIRTIRRKLQPNALIREIQRQLNSFVPPSSHR